MGHIEITNKKNQILISQKIVYPEAINERELKYISDGMMSGILPLKFKRKRKYSLLTCVVEQWLPLSFYQNSIISKTVFMNIVIQLTEIIKECEKNHLNPEKLSLNMDSIFVNPGDMRVYCIFWPVVNTQPISSIGTFFKELPYHMVFRRDEDIQNISDYIHFFEVIDLFSIQRFEKMLLEIEDGNPKEKQAFVLDYYEDKIGLIEEEKVRDTKVVYNPMENVKYAETSVLGTGLQMQATSILENKMVQFPFIIRKKTMEKIEIKKESFIIGKSSQGCDYCIRDNSAISRTHVKISIKNGEIYISDQKSTNGTYLNGKRLEPYKEVLLETGSTILLGDEGFEFFLKEKE